MICGKKFMTSRAVIPLSSQSKKRSSMPLILHGRWQRRLHQPPLFPGTGEDPGPVPDGKPIYFFRATVFLRGEETQNPQSQIFVPFDIMSKRERPVFRPNDQNPSEPFDFFIEKRNGLPRKDSHGNNQKEVDRGENNRKRRLTKINLKAKTPNLG